MHKLAIACFTVGISFGAWANPGTLGNGLTPLGAEQAGSADGLIPAWTGGLTQPPANYHKGMHHPDPFLADQPRLLINQDNLSEHAASLPLGLQQLVKNNPDYHIRVFPTRRSAASPQRIYAATSRNAQQAELISRGNGVRGVSAGIPFPIPQSGLEVIWNHIMRYRGDQVRTYTNHAAVLQGGQIHFAQARARHSIHLRSP